MELTERKNSNLFKGCPETVTNLSTLGLALLLLTADELGYPVD